MPAPAGGAGTHYFDTSSLVLDVTDFIFELTPVDTPFFDLIGNGPTAQAPVHQWQSRDLTVRSDNAQPEGGTFTWTGANRLPVRRFNILQIQSKEGQVSGTQMADRHYGISNLESDQVDILTTELKTDNEHVLLRGTAASGDATATSRRMNGLIPIIQTALSAYTNASGLTITEGMFNAFAQQLWLLGSRPRDILTGGVGKRTVSSFRGGGNFILPADSMKQVNVVDTYTTDFGTVMLHLSRDILTGTSPSAPTNGMSFLWVDKEACKKSWLRTPVAEKSPKVGDAAYYVVLHENTLEYGHPHSNGFMHNYKSIFSS